MKPTVQTAVSARPVTAGVEELGSWANLEARPVLDQTRKAANYTTRYRVVVDTTGSGVSTRLWESEALPTDCTVLARALIAGKSSSGAAQACAYDVVRAFASVGGTISAIAVSAFDYSANTDGGASVPTWDTDPANRSLYVTSADNGVSPYRFTAVIELVIANLGEVVT